MTATNCTLFTQNDADSEWKYARAKLWMSYFEEGGTLPAPFNMIPTPKSVYYIMCWIREKICHCSTTHKRSKWQSIRVRAQSIRVRAQSIRVGTQSIMKGTPS